MKSRRVGLTRTARRHVRREKEWWFENNIHTDVFVTEFEEALRMLAWLPGVGMSYTQAGVAGLRRVYVRKVDCHLYYTFDEHEVTVRAFWGARCRHGSRLRTWIFWLVRYPPNARAEPRRSRCHVRRRLQRVVRRAIGSSSWHQLKRPRET